MFRFGPIYRLVFHAMRALEPALTALCKELGLSFAENWNAALNNIEKEIRSRSRATHGEQWRDDEQFYAESATHFRMLKNAWRNHTVHLKNTYDEDQARVILTSVSDFINHLSTKLSE
jgi:hypothetical protein